MTPSSVSAPSTDQRKRQVCNPEIDTPISGETMEEVAAPLTARAPSEKLRPDATENDRKRPVSAPLRAPSRRAAKNERVQRAFSVACATAAVLIPRLPRHLRHADRFLAVCTEIAARDGTVDIVHGPVIDPAPFYVAQGTEVYAIKDRDRDRVKIGVSANVERRLNGIQLSTAASLEVELRFGGTFAEEMFLHAIFADERVHSEWFALSPRLVDWLSRQREYLSLGRLRRRHAADFYRGDQ